MQRLPVSGTGTGSQHARRLWLRGVEQPARGVVGKVVFGPGENDARADGIQHAFTHDHQRNLVFGAGRGIQLLERGFVIEVYFDRVAFKNDDVIAGFEMNGESGIARQIAGLAGGAGGAEVKSTVEPEAPHWNGMRASVGANGTDPIYGLWGDGLPRGGRADIDAEFSIRRGVGHRGESPDSQRDLGMGVRSFWMLWFWAWNHLEQGQD